METEVRKPLNQIAQEASSADGLSVRQFIGRAVADQLTPRTHQEWLRTRKHPSEELATRALELLDKASGRPVDPNDELPAGYKQKPR